VPVRKRKVENCLSGKLECVRRESDHTYYDLIVDGRVVVWTKVSHGADKDLDGYLLGRMAKQLNISTATFVGAIDCIVSRNDVLDELSARGGL